MSASEVERSKILELLPPGTKEYDFTSREAMVDILEQPYQSPYVVFNKVPSSKFDPLEDESPGRKDYYPKLELLIVNLLDPPHEIAVGTLNGLIITKAIAMDLVRSFRGMGASTQCTPLRCKDPDASYRPVTGRCSRLWPTVVIEVGYSEPREKILRDVAFWLNQSDGKVLLAISIDIKRPSGTIYINTWEQGAVCTRQHPDPPPRQLQQIEISPGNNGSQPSVVGDLGDPLTIPFHALFFRQPVPPEADFVFTEDEVLMIAEDVWRDMEIFGHLED